MTNETDIPAQWRERNPLMTAAGYANLRRILQHPDAPRWNFETGDRLLEGDLREVERFRKALHETPSPSTDPVPPPRILDWVSSMRSRSWWFRDAVPDGADLTERWDSLPTMDRHTLSTRLVDVVPHDLDDFSRLLSYDTSGTTGHAVHVPHLPETVAKNHPFLERVLTDLGIDIDFGPDRVAVVNVCAQVNTFVFAGVFSVWNEGGFAKVNLHEDDWAGGRASARRYLSDLDPQVITSDPASLAEMCRWEIDVRPRAILSTALALSDGLRRRLVQRYGCPVIDWYSTTETGPIAYRATEDDGYAILPHDLFVETLNDRGHPCAGGEVGEIVVTGGRNPWLPLLRYRTGDHARIVRGGRPALYDLHGREVVRFRSADGNPVNSVDIGRIMRLHSDFVQHRFHQRRDRSCEVRIRPIPGVVVDTGGLSDRLRTLFGEVKIEVTIDEAVGARGKERTYSSDVGGEDDVVD